MSCKHWSNHTQWICKVRLESMKLNNYIPEKNHKNIYKTPSSFPLDQYSSETSWNLNSHSLQLIEYKNGTNLSSLSIFTPLIMPHVSSTKRRSLFLCCSSFIDLYIRSCVTIYYFLKVPLFFKKKNVWIVWKLLLYN